MLLSGSFPKKGDLMVQNTISFIQALAWPVTVLISLVVFRKPIISVLDRLKVLQGPGDFKLSLDEHEVKKMIEEGNDKKEDPASIARRIMTVMDKRESRILRALLDDSGRRIYNYQSDYYKDALDSLIKKGLVQKYENGFALSPKGIDFTESYLQAVFEKGQNKQ